MLPRRARVDLGAMAMKGCSVFPKTPALLEPHHQIVYSHIQRGAVSVFYSPSRLGNPVSVQTFTVPIPWDLHISPLIMATLMLLFFQTWLSPALTMVQEQPESTSAVHGALVWTWMTSSVSFIVCLVEINTILFPSLVPKQSWAICPSLLQW